MATKAEQNKATTAYRRAARKLYGYTREQAEACIYPPHADPGEWAPKGLVILNLEAGLEALDYYGPDFVGGGIALQEAAGTGYVEHHNAAIAVVWPA